MRNEDAESERLTLLAIVFKLGVQCIPPLACISLHLSTNALHWQHEYLYDSLDHHVVGSIFIYIISL